MFLLAAYSAVLAAMVRGMPSSPGLRELAQERAMRAEKAKAKAKAKAEAAEAKLAKTKALAEEAKGGS